MSVILRAWKLCQCLICVFLRCTGLDLPRDNGLKLFLEKDDMERLYDFEEECVEGYFREQEIVLNQSTDERIKATNDRVENMTQKVEDINQKENLQSATVQVFLKKIFRLYYIRWYHYALLHRTLIFDCEKSKNQQNKYYLL